MSKLNIGTNIMQVNNQNISFKGTIVTPKEDLTFKQFEMIKKQINPNDRDTKTGDMVKIWNHSKSPILKDIDNMKFLTQIGVNKFTYVSNANDLHKSQQVKHQEI